MLRSCSSALRLVSRSKVLSSPLAGPQKIAVDTTDALLRSLPQLHQRLHSQQQRSLLSKQLQQPVSPSSSSRSATTSTNAPPKGSASYVPKPWLDGKRSIESRVQELLEASAFHPADFHDAAMQDLVKQCCQMGNLEGMQLAQDVIDRLLVEKRRLQQATTANATANTASGGGVGGKTTTTAVYVVPLQLIQTLLYGWAVLASDLRVAQNRMREVLQLAIEEAKQDGIALEKIRSSADQHSSASISSSSQSSSSQPTVQLFNTYLRGLANAAKLTPQAAVNGEAMLYEMAEYSQSLGWHTKPNTRSYTHVITAFAKTGHPGSGQRAFNLLRRMQQVHESEKAAYEQEYGIPYNMMMVQGVGGGGDDDLPTAAAAGKNKRHIVTPDAAVYTSTMKALIESNRTPEKVIDLLNEAIQAEGVRLDEGLFIMTMKSLGSTIETERNAKKRIKSAKQAEDILLMMVEYASHKGFDHANATKTDGDDEDTDSRQSLPTDRSGSLLTGYNACMDTWARAYCVEAAPHCESILRKMIEADGVKPDTVSFNTCLYAWSRAHKFHADAAQRAADLLNLQLELSTPHMLGDGAKPDFQSFTTCIMAQADSVSPDKVQHARSLLDSLLARVTSGDLQVTRNPTAPFSAVLSVIAKSTPSKGPSDVSIIATDELDGFTSVVDTDADPYSIAKMLYENVESDFHGIGTSADLHAASAFLRCIVAHTTPESTERVNTARRVFENACQAGQVSRSVIQAFKDALGGRAAGFHGLHSKNPPKFWSSSVPAAFR